MPGTTMPGTYMPDSPSSSPSRTPPLLKAHKVLPHHPQRPHHKSTLSTPVRSSITDSAIDHSPQRGLHIASQTATHVNSGLPPTPPSNPESATRLSAPKPSEMRGPSVPLFAEDTSGLSTPVNHLSPPTPDYTPPRDVGKLTPRQARYPEYSPSQTDSFETAREDPWMSNEYIARSLHNESDSQTPTRIRDHSLLPERRNNARDKEAFKAPVPEHHQSAAARAIPEAISMTPEPVTGNRIHAHSDRSPRKRRPKTKPVHLSSPNSPIQHSPSASPPVPRDDSIPSLRERVQQSRAVERRPSVEKFAEQIAWPKLLDQLLIQMSPSNSDTQRYSGMSNTSTIVEAIVFDNTSPTIQRSLKHARTNLAMMSHDFRKARPPDVSSGPARRRHKLKHKKSGSLEEARVSVLSSPAPKIPTKSVVRTQNRSEDLRNARTKAEHELNLSNTTNEPIPLKHSESSSPQERRKDPSQGSAPGSAARKELREGRKSVRVVVIPERRSSLASARRNSQLQKTRSLAGSSIYSGQSHPGDGSTSSETRRLRKRPGSVSTASVKSADYQIDPDFPPMIPTRSSSLSAPTSRNVSRTGSLTSASAPTRPKVRNSGDSGKPRALSSEPLSYSRENPKQPSTSRAETLAAPFSPLLSISDGHSTPDALEVKEATAISLHHHRNHSLLVVESSSSSRPVSRDLNQTASGAENLLTTPPTTAQSQAQNSPLKYPRDPPELPDVKIIPPTPAVMTPADEVNRELGGATDKGSPADKARFGRPLSLVRRALGTRRFSESHIPALSSLRNLDKPDPRAQDRRSNRLSPFWNPRGFWEDVDLDDEEIEEEFLERGRSELLEVPRNTERRLTYPAYCCEACGGTNGRLIRKSSTPSLRSRRGDKKRRLHTIPGFGVQVEFVGLKGMAKRLRETRLSMAEQARERQRNKIKHRISPPQPVENIGLGI